ncbi:uncharacterized protein bub1ba isoform X2 [Mastacembelus armatus]|nr:uncharacterized protein LOC113131181 isoform X2 [Mastacembelus armatus]
MECNVEATANQRNEYCKELLMRGGEELSFEELRAERYHQRKMQEMEERLNHLDKVKEQLSQELEEKKHLLLRRRRQAQPLASTDSSSNSVSAASAAQVAHEDSTSQTSSSRRPPATASFQIYDESQSAAAEPAGNSEPPPPELVNDVFLRPYERGLCLQVQCPPPGHHGRTREDRFTFIPQQPVSKTTKELSPIEETSVEAASMTSLRGLSAGTCSPLEEDQDQEEMDHTLSSGSVQTVLVTADPCDPNVLRQLLKLCDVTSSPHCHSEPRVLPVVEKDAVLELGGTAYLIHSRVLDRGSFSVYQAAAEDRHMLIKVDSCSVPWDFHQFSRLKNSSPAMESLPLISCFLFLDGCITIYTAPSVHMFMDLTEGAGWPSKILVAHKAVSLLQLVSQLHSSKLLHAALQPNILAWSQSPDVVFPVDWSSSVDLDLQRDVMSVQQLCSAQTYIRLGLLEPTAPAYLVDLVGLAETVHLLLTSRNMVLVKDNEGWTAEQFSGDEPCDMFSQMWRRFFRSLLNASGCSTLSVLSELKEQILAIYR